ncbi:hypothetical protein T439DRAFT_324613 [Meredithblackwellia eburnea MCA 4105]
MATPDYNRELKVFAPGEWKDETGTGVPYSSLLGTWHVVASTLPLWKDKKNVTITYSSIQGEKETTMDDVVAYNKRNDPVGKEASTVKGVDRIEEGSLNAWKWRGRGLLMIASSRWQLLGFNVHSPSTLSSEPEWVLTYFKSTLFTPAGLDIYARTAKGLDDEFVQKIVQGVEKLGGEVGELVKDGGMFRVPHD